MKTQILEQIARDKVIAIARGISQEYIGDLAQALYKGGITCMEITFDQSGRISVTETLRAIDRAKEKMEDKMAIGAGTVMTPHQAEQAVSAGADYIISPNVDQAVIEKTVQMSKIAIPGAMTPTEVAAAWNYGADFVKLFPAGMLGADYIKALKGPLPHIPLIAVGGVHPQNGAAFIKAGASGIGCGGNLVSKALVSQGHLDQITKMACQYKTALEEE